MTRYAVDAVESAVDATRAFLLPVDLRRWAKLALVVLFAGGGTGNVPGGLPSGTSDPTAPGGPAPAVPSDGTLLAVGALALAVVLLVAVVGATMRFVLYDALRTDAVRIRGPFRRRVGQAVRYLLFQVGVGLLLLAPVAVVAGVVAVLGGGPEAFTPATVVALVSVAGLLFLLYLLVSRFTAEFVVPVMTLRGGGVLPAWRAFWPTLRREWKAFLLYLVVHFLLALGVGVAAGLLLLVLGGLVVAAGGLAGFVVVGVFGGLDAALGAPAGLALLAVVGLVVGAVLLALVLAVRVVTTVFLRTYELSVLAAAEREFTLLAASLRPAADDGSA